MNEDTQDLLIVIGCIIVLLGILIGLILYFYDPEQEYQDALEKLDNYQKLCELAGFIFESEHLKSPEEQAEENYYDFNYVEPKCYELRNFVKIYYDLNDFEFIDFSSTFNQSYENITEKDFLTTKTCVLGVDCYSFNAGEVYMEASQNTLQDEGGGNAFK